MNTRTVSKSVLFDLISEGTKVDSERSRHGSRICYHVNHEGEDYLTEYIDVYPEEGLQIWHDKNILRPATLTTITSQVWTATKE